MAAREGKHEIDAFLDVAVAGQLQVGFATPMLVTPPEAMKEIATSPVALPGVSDGGAHTKFVTTARYPTELLGYWVREHEIMSLEEAHWRLSYYPAVAAGLKGRGFLAEGAPADVVVYDPETVDSTPQERVWDYPAGEWRLIQKAVGYDRTIVNGVTTFVDGECTEDTPGQAAPPRHGLRRESHAHRRIRDHRRSSTPTTTTGRSATPSPDTATLRSPIEVSS